ncbi:MAG: hypothetical protein AAFR61_13785 [Bacteroidota bacterium]
MSQLRLFFVFVLLTLGALGQELPPERLPRQGALAYEAFSPTKGALLTTHFESLEAFKEAVDIEYQHIHHGFWSNPMVRITHKTSGRKVESILKEGINEYDFTDAKKGGFGQKAWLGLSSPYAVFNRRRIQRAYFLAKRIDKTFGADDVAFYDLAEAMVCHLRAEEVHRMPANDLSEKGYLNTFNHQTGQCFTTAIFSEKLADFMADAHELSRIPELVTGAFSEKQILDINEGAVDNYIDLINNEWGQEIGKTLRAKYGIEASTHWTPELVTAFLNDLQRYYSWALNVGFEPFRTSDPLMIRFAKKINMVMGDLSILRPND